MKWPEGEKVFEIMPPLGKLDKNELKIFMVNDYIVLHVTDTTPSSQRNETLVVLVHTMYNN